MSEAKPPYVAYLAGPMRGLPGCNFEAFFAAERKWSVHPLIGKIVNPARMDVETLKFVPPPEQTAISSMDLRLCLKRDLSAICDECEAMIMLPGWENSRGAVTEHALAKALNLKIFYENDFPVTQG